MLASLENAQCVMGALDRPAAYATYTPTTKPRDDDLYGCFGSLAQLAQFTELEDWTIAFCVITECQYPDIGSNIHQQVLDSGIA